ncbi:MAG: hypothetical protein AAF411_19315 [Myxococcota bacterium]
MRRMLIALALATTAACSTAVDDFRTCEPVVVPQPLAEVCSRDQTNLVFACTEERLNAECGDCNVNQVPCAECREAATNPAIVDCIETRLEAESPCQTCFLESPTDCLNLVCFDEYESFLCCTEECRARGDEVCAECQPITNRYIECASSMDVAETCGNIFFGCIVNDG